MYIINT